MDDRERETEEFRATGHNLNLQQMDATTGRTKFALARTIEISLSPFFFSFFFFFFRCVFYSRALDFSLVDNSISIDTVNLANSVMDRNEWSIVIPSAKCGVTFIRLFLLYFLGGGFVSLILVAWVHLAIS